MSRTLAFALFIGTAVLILGALHYYIWARMVRDPRLPSPWNRVAVASLVALGGSAIASRALRHVLPELEGWLAWAAYVWLGVMFLLFWLLLTTDAARLLSWIARRLTGDGAPGDPERRVFLSRVLAGGVSASAAGLAGYGTYAARAAVEVKRVHVHLKRLPRALDGLTLVQLTDMHVGPTIGRDFVQEIVTRTNALRPDIIAITGDLVDGSVAELRDSVAPLGELTAPLGVYFVTGNHEYFSGATEWVNELGRLGIRVLRNERLSIGRGDATFDLAGVDDRNAARFSTEGHGEDLERALRGRDPNREVVLLAHQPRTMLDAVKYGIGLQISGHTHGGQLWPWGFFVKLQQGFLAGLHHHRGGQLYVSCGTGYWGPPMRLGAPAEIAEIVLRSASA